MLQYILECIAFQLLFLIIYDLFLKRETFFQGNRLYLIGTYIISMALPWIKIEAMKTKVPESFQAYPEFLWNLNDTAVTAVVVEETSLNISWEYVLLFGGMFIATLFFAYKLYQIYTLKRSGEIHYFKDFTQIIISNSSIAFSFFKSIFLGDKVMEKEHESIVQHELVHIRQRHSYDLMFFELMRIVGWFNPLVYVYQSRVSELHEFIADAQVAKTDKKEHYEFLLSQIFQTQHISFINQFFKTSLIKKRIVMLQKTQSKRIWRLKYLLLVPMVFGMLAYTSAESESIQIEESAQIQTKDDEELIIEVKEEIEKEINDIIENYEISQKAGRYGSMQKREKAIFHIRIMNRENDKSRVILSKRQYFKREILTKMFFESIKPVEFGDDVLPRTPLPKLPWPSSSRYESYVSRKEAFYILDPNLQFSIKAYDQQVGLIDKQSNYSNSSFLFEVENVKDFTGEELRKFNNSLEKISRNKSTYNALILTDGMYTFKIYMETPTRIDVSQVNYEGIVSREGKTIQLNVLNARELTKAENEQREMLIKEFTESDYYERLIISDGVYETTILSVEDNGVLITSGKEPDPVPFAMVEQVPIFPGCENVEDKRKCFNEKIQKHISKNFYYPKKAQQKGIQGRVNTIFVISKKGKIEGLRMRGPDSLLEKEVARIIGKLPKMKPGKHKGKRVDVPFSIPIEFKLKDDLFEKYLGNKEKPSTAVDDLVKKYDQLSGERERLLKSSNEKNPIIVNLDQQLKKFKESLNGSLRDSINNLDNSLKSLRESLNKSKSSSVVIDKRVAEEQYLLLLKERERLLLNSNDKNPIIVNLDKQIKDLKKVINQGNTTIPFATVDKVPVFPGCEDAENKRKCFNEKMQKHISKNFNYPQEAQDKGIQGRVSVMFTIASDGSIQNIRKRGPDSLLEKEVERIIKRLPKMKPGMHKGKAVNVPFSIPVTFKLQEDKDEASLKLNSNDSAESGPLVIIDGKEASWLVLHAMSPDEIESMNVIKDEAATRKYGDKGKNGVIEVKTKN